MLALGVVWGWIYLNIRIVPPSFSYSDTVSSGLSLYLFFVCMHVLGKIIKRATEKTKYMNEEPFCLD